MKSKIYYTQATWKEEVEDLIKNDNSEMILFNKCDIPLIYKKIRENYNNVGLICDDDVARKIFNNYPIIDCYIYDFMFKDPYNYMKLFNRDIKQHLSTERKLNYPRFVKPLFDKFNDEKQAFEPFIANSDFDMHKVDIPFYSSNVVKFVHECRFIYYNKITEDKTKIIADGLIPMGCSKLDKCPCRSLVGSYSFPYLSRYLQNNKIFYCIIDIGLTDDGNVIIVEINPFFGIEIEENSPYLNMVNVVTSRYMLL